MKAEGGRGRILTAEQTLNAYVKRPVRKKKQFRGSCLLCSLFWVGNMWHSAIFQHEAGTIEKRGETSQLSINFGNFATRSKLDLFNRRKLKGFSRNRIK